MKFPGKVLSILTLGKEESKLKSRSIPNKHEIIEILVNFFFLNGLSKCKMCEIVEFRISTENCHPFFSTCYTGIEREPVLIHCEGSCMAKYATLAH